MQRAAGVAFEERMEPFPLEIWVANELHLGKSEITKAKALLAMARYRK